MPKLDVAGELLWFDRYDGITGRILPGWYVRDAEAEQARHVDDPIYPHRVTKALGMGETTRNLIAVDEGGTAHVVESALEASEYFPGGRSWRAVLRLLATPGRDELRLILPLGAVLPVEDEAGAPVSLFGGSITVSGGPTPEYLARLFDGPGQ